MTYKGDANDSTDLKLELVIRHVISMRLIEKPASKQTKKKLNPNTYIYFRRDFNLNFVDLGLIGV